jgi:coenzyme F420-0:L-glutamate ligase / coenzyme F420-1:gamma-L-glutamate ligase
VGGGSFLERLKRLKRLQLSPGVLRLIRSARIAHLATADAGNQPHVIPICFVFDGKCFYSPIDEKPKRTAPRNLRRVRNIVENPQASLVIDRYDEDWGRLAYALISGKARIVSQGEKHAKAVRLLRRKYRQYRSMAIHERPMIVIRPTRLLTWGRP